MRRKLLSVVLACVMLIGVIAACADNNAPSGTTQTPASTPTPASGTPATAAPAPAPAELPHVNLTMYLLGDEPTDLALVYDTLVNPLLNEKINATLTTNYLSWGDYRDRYGLILAAGEDVDLIFTSDWAFYSEESARGAFMEFTPEFMEAYMPNTVKYQSPASLNQATLNGRIFGIPKNVNGLETENWPVIRKDLREKYGMDEIKTVADLEAFFLAVLENEDGIFPHHASGDGGWLNVMYQQPNRIFIIANTDIVFQYPGNDDAPPVDAFTYLWFRDDMIDYFNTMKRWGDMGFWSANAINNDVQVRDSFQNGRSASLTWNFTIFRAGEMLRQNNPEWDFEPIDINPGTTRRSSYFTNDMIAIAAASRNQERAGMFIDLLKDEADLEFYLALIGGIEDVHYTLNPDGTRGVGPQGDRYPWNPSTWCFNLAPGVAPDQEIGNEPWNAVREERAWQESQVTMMKNPASMGFRFDQAPVRAEMTAINALRDEYRPMLQLGMVADVQGTWDEWKAKAEAAGLETVMNEFRNQYNAWLATR